MGQLSPNKGYGLPDDASDLYFFQPDPSTTPIATAIDFNINSDALSYLDGEGMAYRASNNQVYAFQDNSTTNTTDLYRIYPTDRFDGSNILAGDEELVKADTIAQGVGGADFYTNPTTLEETFYILYSETFNTNGDGGPYTKIAVLDPETGLQVPNAFGTGVSELTLKDDVGNNGVTQLESLAIDPNTGRAYGLDDRNSNNSHSLDSSDRADIYEIDLATGETTFVAELDLNADAESFSFGNDGTPYVETDNGDLNTRTVYEVDVDLTQTNTSQVATLTAAATFPGTGDMEGSAFNVGTSIFAPNIDLDGNNSSGATDTEYQTTFTPGSGGISIADTDTTITDVDNNALSEVTIVLTNAQTDDELLVGTLPTDITFSIDTNVSGEITVTLTAASGASLEDFSTAIEAISFNNTGSSPNTSDRTIEVSGIDVEGLESNTAFSTISVNAAIDYGDAPDSYGTLVSNSGASHTVNDSLYLGTVSPDGDAGNLTNASATADDNNNVNDENGVANFGTLDTANSTYSVTVDYSNATVTDATLVGWIDFNGDGDFDSATEASNIATAGTASTSQVLTWTIPGDVQSGTTYARFRINEGTSSLTSSSFSGALGDGEVEDYQINIEGGSDYGDAPASYDTGTAASHGIVDGLTIGSIVDSETVAASGSAATGDDLDNLNDDDGVTFVDGKVISTNDGTYSIEVEVNNSLSLSATDNFDSGNYTEGSGWNSNWTETGTELGDDPNSDSIRVLDTDSDGDTELRFTGNALYGVSRSFDSSNLSNDTTITIEFDYEASGLKNGDEYKIRIGNQDLLTINSNTSDPNFSTTILKSQLSDNSFTIDKTGTGGNGANTNDTLVVDNISITADVTPTLIGWIDLDGNGTFDSTEAQTATVSSGTTANTLTWDVSSATAGDTYARFRVSSDSLTTSDATGTATNGEVQDYALEIRSQNEVTGTGGSELIDGSYSDPTTTGDDIITGGAGQDTLTGNGGDDTYHFNQTSDGVDVITDFNNGDLLDLSDLFDTGGELEGISNPFGTYVNAVSYGSGTNVGTMIQIDVDPTDSVFDKDLVFLRGVAVGTIDASDFIF